MFVRCESEEGARLGAGEQMFTKLNIHLPELLLSYTLNGGMILKICNFKLYVDLAAGLVSLNRDWLRAGRSGVRPIVRVKFSGPVQIGTEAQPASSIKGTGSRSRDKDGGA